MSFGLFFAFVNFTGVIFIRVLWDISQLKKEIMS